MSLKSITLADLVSPNSQVPRSVNLERDLSDRNILANYQLTDKGIEILRRFVAALEGEPRSAWSLTGPYGMGKSSFAHFLLCLCGPARDRQTQLARRILHSKAPSLCQDFQKILSRRGVLSRGLFRITVTASYESINQSLVRALQRAVVSSKAHYKKSSTELSAFLEKIGFIASAGNSIPTEILELIKQLQDIIGIPVVVVMDEFGKNLEFTAKHPDVGDLFLLQAMAETRDIFVWVCLHQAFDEYSSELTSKQIQEWGKIQGRFEDIAFFEPASQMINFIGQTLIRKASDEAFETSLSRWAEAFVPAVRSLGVPEAESWDTSTIKGLFPLHPLSVLLLPQLCMRFAQNDRTLFSFLCGGEPHALPAFLSHQRFDANVQNLPTFGPELLYDYFLMSTTGFLVGRPESQRWVEVQDIVNRSKNLDPLLQSILKVIGLLNLVSGSNALSASKQLVNFAFLRPLDFFPVESDQVRDAVQDLLLKGMVLYRKYADEYRLWEGSDFDLDSAIKKQISLARTQSIHRILEETVPLSPLVASRHSYHTGTLRRFERRWSNLATIMETPLGCESTESDGLILYCFPDDLDPKKLPSKTMDSRPVVVACAINNDRIRTMVLEAAASKTVLASSPELARDGVARKEAAFRAHRSENRLNDYVEALFTPGSPDTKWFLGPDQIPVMSHKDLSQFLSDVCDESFAKCPVIRNELINRNRLSSAAARARRELIEAMLTNERIPLLGMSGTGPEVAIYRTTLLAEGFHQKMEDGTMKFVSPSERSTFFEAWKAIGDLLSSQEQDASVEVSQVIQMLQNPPFGMKQGPIPVLLALFLIVKSDEVVLYQEGAFVPFIGPEEMELMTKRPEYFSLRQFSLTNDRLRVFEAYSQLLQASVETTDRRLRNVSIVSIVGPLVQFANQLPQYVRHTKTLSQYAQKVRHALLHARDPLRLLYTDIPSAIGLGPFNEVKPISEKELGEFTARFHTVLMEISQTYSQLLEKIRKFISDEFNSDPGDLGSLRRNIGLRAEAIKDSCGERDLKAFLGALANGRVSDEQWLVTLATVATQRPVDSWRDSDVNVLSSRIADLVQRFYAFEAVTAAQTTLFPNDNHKEPRLVALTRPDGTTYKEICWLKKEGHPHLTKLLDSVSGDLSKEDLKTLFVMMGDLVFHENDLGETSE